MTQNPAAERQLLIDNLELILANRDYILAHDSMARARSMEAFLELTHETGGGYLPIGMLLELWQGGDMLEACPRCPKESGPLYLIAMAGSPLSEFCHWWGICIRCRKLFQEGSWVPPLMARAMPVLKKMKEWEAKQKPGRAGTPRVNAFSIKQLVKRLKAL